MVLNVVDFPVPKTLSSRAEKTSPKPVGRSAVGSKITRVQIRLEIDDPDKVERDLVILIAQAERALKLARRAQIMREPAVLAGVRTILEGAGRMLGAKYQVKSA